MNLETFKARARRKLELPNRGKRPSSARTETNATKTLPETSATKSTVDDKELEKSKADGTTLDDPNSNTDKFAAALSFARDQELKRSSQIKNAPTQELTDTQTRTPATTSMQPLTPSSTNRVNQESTAQADETELSRLRSLLLGNSHRDQQDQVNAVQQRTQAGLNDLRQDMDTRLDDLTKYVGQLEQSILNSIEVRAEASDHTQLAMAAESAEARVNEQNARLDAFDARLTNTLAELRAEYEAGRETDRANLKKELAEANARTDALIEGISTRLETSITGIEGRLSKQLNNQSMGLVADSETTVNNLRTQLGNLIDDRVRTFNDQQTNGLGELRDILVANTQNLNAELKLQTEQQRNTLQSHRTEIEKQLNSAIQELNQSKVSHKDLSQLLSRLADRLKHI